MKLAGRGKAVLSTILALVLLGGCATLGANAPKPFFQMTSKEKVVYAQEIYIKVYDDTMFMGKNPNLTPAQLKVYRVKKELLTEAWQVIYGYKVILEVGNTPTPAQEQELLQLINRLVTAGTET